MFFHFRIHSDIYNKKKPNLGITSKQTRFTTNTNIKGEIYIFPLYISVINLNNNL